MYHFNSSALITLGDWCDHRTIGPASAMPAVVAEALSCYFHLGIGVAIGGEIGLNLGSLRSSSGIPSTSPFGSRSPNVRCLRYGTIHPNVAPLAPFDRQPGFQSRQPHAARTRTPPR